MKSDSTYQNTTKDVSERLGSVSLLQGKETIPVAGGAGGGPRLGREAEGEPDRRHSRRQGIAIIYPKFEFPEPVISFAIEPKSRGDEEKISSAMQRLSEEDPMLKFHRESELLLVRHGPTPHRGRGLAAEAEIRRRGDPPSAEGPLSRDDQRNVRGPRPPQEADGRPRPVRATAGSDSSPYRGAAQFEFANEVFGGAIPKNFIPAVEKGIQEARVKGFLAGFPMVDFKATVVRREVPSRGFVGNGLQDRGLARLQRGDVARPPDDPGAGDARGGLRAERLCRRSDG